MHRLFLAIWPSAAACQRLADVTGGIPWSGEAALVRPENWHVTLHFIGNVPSTRLDEMIHGLEVPFEPFSLSMNRKITWGRLTVLEPNTVTGPLARLHQKLTKALLQLNLPVESRPFRPHITLARRPGSKTQPKHYDVIEDSIIAPIRWRVKEYALVESMPGGRSSYTCLRSYRAVPASARK